MSKCTQYCYTVICNTDVQKCFFHKTSTPPSRQGDSVCKERPKEQTCSRHHCFHCGEKLSRISQRFQSASSPICYLMIINNHTNSHHYIESCYHQTNQDQNWTSWGGVVQTQESLSLMGAGRQIML